MTITERDIALDRLVCEGCGNVWAAPDRRQAWNEKPERDDVETCSTCGSTDIFREERARTL